MNPSIVILQYARAIREEKKYIDVITWSFRESVDLILWAHTVAEPRHDQLQQPQLPALPPQACTVGTRHESSGGDSFLARQASRKS